MTRSDAVFLLQRTPLAKFLIIRYANSYLLLQTITLFSVVNDANLIYAQEFNLLENQLRGPRRLFNLL